MSRGIDDVEAVVSPETSRRSRLNGNTALSFLFHKIGGGFAIMNFTGFVNFAGQLQDTFGGGGFTGVNVSEDANISVLR